MTKKVDGNLNVTKENKAILTDKTVRVVPVIRSGGWLKDGHDGEFMFTGCKVEIDLPIDRRSGRLVSILTREEQAFFEKELFLNEGDLSIYKKEDNYWHSFRVRLDKEDDTLNLADPIDNLKWRILMVSPICAPSWEERHKSGEFQWALVDADVQTQEKVKKANRRKDAYRFLGKIEGDAEKMRNVLRLYGDTPAPDASKGFMVGKIDEIIEDDRTLEKLLGIINDPHFDTKLFIDDAIQAGAIFKKGTRYSLPGGDKIGGTLLETIDYLNDKANQDVRLKIKTQIELNK